jgi:hypothetical protein
MYIKADGELPNWATGLDYIEEFVAWCGIKAFRLEGVYIYIYILYIILYINILYIKY